MPLTLNQMMNKLTLKQQTKILNHQPPTSNLTTKSKQYTKAVNQPMSTINLIITSNQQIINTRKT